MDIHTGDPESNPTRKKSESPQFDIEKTAKILSLVAIPLVIALFGWMIQNQLSQRSLSQEYVKLAVSILQSPKSSEVPAGLRDWAVDLLNENSPTKFSPETVRQLKAGDINLAGVLNTILAIASKGGGIAVSPDGSTVVTGQDDGTVAIWDIRTGILKQKLSGQNAPISAVIFSPDAKMLFSGDSDGSVSKWDVATGKMLQRLQGSSPVLGLAVSPDLHSLIVRYADRTVRIWDVSTGQLLKELRLTSPTP
jgi:WD40 repeat protein